MHNLLRYYRQNRMKVWIIIFAVIFAFAILKVIQMQAEETKENARAAAAQITESAVAKAEEIIGSARTRAFELEQDIHRLESRYELMKTRVKLLLYAEIELLDKNEIISQKEADYPQEGETFQNPQQS